ncbi:MULTISPECIES: glutamate synthase subunit beta [Muribaculum]|jgi:glutamate synthase, NADH/NADPH, small subunit|uniref:glutamate synthase subunit beta n=2 Tax=Muribaculaceae TaxID=2005473 RepID=UPI000F47B189|nr:MULTISPECIES: glutamate synthase subunit beta [Muribaculum]MCX4277282.1 glutamate synthase subunit beta [Muribaculum sp.]ROT13136.1 glutamate synthase subunit beta [Muribaculaceae bacterium Isolate-102 (HZI)]TGY05883.1 glutamate synthase subunit beta [Muribaculum sp. NM65_B17]THG43596.1 glutamate synthase subunit beta [Muribaculaceae bacterium]
MGNPKAFLTIHRKEAGYRPVSDRIRDYGEVEQTLNPEDRRLQASRCMECGVPFCHWSCPLGNKQPEWQDRLFKNDIKGAYTLLTATDDFPEFTGRVCPALCEKGCVLNKIHEPVTIRENEAAIVERAFLEGYVKPYVPKHRTGKRVAVIGSGPAGLACANQLNRRGHSVTVFEKNEAIGGLLRFGIPDFKLNKSIIDRRVALMTEEGVEFKPGVEVGKDIAVEDIVSDYDAVCIAIGAEVPRDLKVEGRDLKGVHFALELLQQQNRVNAGREISRDDRISAKGKNVLVIGGGDTGSDCVGTANRQGALSVTQIEIMPKPPEGENPATPWPYWPVVLKTSSSHDEGCNRRWLLDTRRIIGENGKVTEVEVEEVRWEKDEATGRMNLIHTRNVERIKAELVLLAMGFTNPVQDGILKQLEVEKDARGNVKVDDKQQSSIDKVFAAGDASTGASLVVRCIASGRKAAEGIHNYLTEK